MSLILIIFDGWGEADGLGEGEGDVASWFDSDEDVGLGDGLVPGEELGDGDGDGEGKEKFTAAEFPLSM